MTEKSLRETLRERSLAVKKRDAAAEEARMLDIMRRIMILIDKAADEGNMSLALCDTWLATDPDKQYELTRFEFEDVARRLRAEGLDVGLIENGKALVRWD